MQKRCKKTLTRTLGWAATCAHIALIGTLFAPGFYLLREVQVKVPDVKSLLHLMPVPKYKELVRIYDVVKSNRPEIGESEAWRVADVILEESSKHNLDPILVAALIEVESGFRPTVVSPVGARGIMQIMPDVGKAIAQEIGLKIDSGSNPFRPEQLDDPVLNIKLGTYYLNDLKKNFRSLNHALVAYNVGPTEMRNRLENEIDFPIEFVNAVLSVYRKYQKPTPPLF